MDNTNWRRANEPESFSVGDSQYATGDGDWSFSSNTFTFTDTYSGTQNISMMWSDHDNGGNTGGTTTTDITTEEPTTTIQETEKDTSEIPPELILVGCIVVVAILAYGENFHKLNNSLRKNYKKIKNRKNQNGTATNSGNNT
ncbi:hypothetical protein GH146_02735 [archaeon]|jgi:hypothetical protein|nr:hypothetical protein [archaeon]